MGMDRSHAVVGLEVVEDVWLCLILFIDSLWGFGAGSRAHTSSLHAIRRLRLSLRGIPPIHRTCIEKANIQNIFFAHMYPPHLYMRICAKQIFQIFTFHLHVYLSISIF